MVQGTHELSSSPFHRLYTSLGKYVPVFCFTIKILKYKHFEKFYKRIYSVLVKSRKLPRLPLAYMYYHYLLCVQANIVTVWNLGSGTSGSWERVGIDAFCSRAISSFET